MALEQREVHDSVFVFKNNFLRAQEQSILTCRKLNKKERNPAWMNKVRKNRHKKEA